MRKWTTIAVWTIGGAALGLAACDTGPAPNGGNGNNSPPAGNGQPAGPQQPGIRFEWPAGDATLTDDQSAMIKAAITCDRPMQIKIELDSDTTPNNGNEVSVASGMQVGAPGGAVQAELRAGWYPYGSYLVRVNLNDGANWYPYAAFGLLNIRSSGTNAGDLNTGLQDVAGLRLLHTSGLPGQVNGRVPFVDTWHVLDPLDNLSPRMIVPFEVTEPVELHRAQFYVFGRLDPNEKRVEIWRGTNEDSPGDLLTQVDARTTSYRTGGWNMMTFDPPVTLSAGRYGISFHSKYEFNDHWAGNAASGSGYAWVSAFGGAPFRKLTAAEFGFEPNFTVRILGKLAAKSGGLKAHRVAIPGKPASIVTPEAEDPPRAPKEQYDYERERSGGGENPIHVVWRPIE